MAGEPAIEISPTKKADEEPKEEVKEELDDDDFKVETDRN